MKSTTQTYNDGLLKISSVKDISLLDVMVTSNLTDSHTGIRYEDRTVGMSRFWQASQSDVKIARLLRCQKISDVTALDVVTTEDGQSYKIEQIQYPKGIDPPSMDLSLSVVLVKAELDGD